MQETFSRKCLSSVLERFIQNKRFYNPSLFGHFCFLHLTIREQIFLSV
jgi:hypothetical protein